MSDSQFKVMIGAKRQMTVPAKMMQLLDLAEGDELLCEVSADQATLTPIFSIARTDLPESLRQQFIKRRGKKPNDLNLSEFVDTLKDDAVEFQHAKSSTRETTHQPRQQAAQSIARETPK